MSNSGGNEPATQAFRKGVKTGVIKGKAYFTQWSFDVVFEGFGVPRHQDLVGHNNGSMPSNTAVFPYLSRASRSDCKQEEKRIERACQPESEDSESRKELRKKSPLLKALKAARVPKTTDKGKKDKSHWTDDHCDGLGISIGNNLKNAQDYIENMKSIYSKLPSEMKIMQAMKDELQEMVTKAGAKAFAKWGARAAVKQGAGTIVPGWGNVAMGAVSAVDAVLTIGEVSEIRRVAIESLEKLDVLQQKGKELHDLSKKFKNFDPTNSEEALKLGAEGQDLLATLNDCTRARKCNLVPKGKKDGSRNVETADGKGCCPGQTGHHLIYDAMIKDANCPGYEYKTAPTVCVEGGSQNHGSHARVHNAMDEQVVGLARAGKLKNGTMSLDDAISAAVKSHKEAFSTSRCKDNCIRAQLEGYYKTKCPNVPLNAKDKHGGDVRPDRGGADSI